MKKIAGLLLSAAIFAQCNQANKPTEGNSNLSVTANPSQTPSNPNLQLTQKGTPTSLKGNIKGATPNSKVFLDRKTADASETIGSVATAADGSFSLSVGITEAGIYRLRIGLAAAYFVLEGGENIDIQATVDGENMQTFAVTGSELAAELPKLTVAKSMSEKEIANFLSKTPSVNAFVNYFLLEKLPLDKHLSLAEKVFTELEKKSPNGANTLSLGAKISSLKVSLNAGGGEVAIGKVPPDIQLKNPDGKVIALSSLKGKVVLLDFWASWCGPCRRENPNVVRIYEQYKSKGFTVYSVSLDGLDDQRLMAMQGNADAINQQLEGQRQRWIGAIQQDKLSWENHVSDLRGWSCSAAVTYGVNSIPRTYLLNRSGQIVAMDLRGAALEEAVKKYIN